MITMILVMIIMWALFTYRDMAEDRRREEMLRNNPQLRWLYQLVDDIKEDK